MCRCLRLLVLVAIFAVVLFLGHGVILGKAGGYLLKSDELKPADAIVILSGEEKERIEYGVKLFKDGWARKDRIIMSGGPAVGNHTSASLMKEYAGYLGVPGRYVLTEDRSRSTEENAVYTKGILNRKGYRSIILVTSPYHSKRASVIFQEVLGRQVKVISAPCKRSWFSFDEWWKRRRDRDMVLSEFSKFLRIWIFGVDTRKAGEAEEGN